jgi:hypothetical protein
VQQGMDRNRKMYSRVWIETGSCPAGLGWKQEAVQQDQDGRG